MLFKGKWVKRFLDFGFIKILGLCLYSFVYNFKYNFINVYIILFMFITSN